MTGERRHPSRVEKKLRVTVERLAPQKAADRGRLVEAELQDASRAGVGFVSAEPFALEEVVRATLHFDRDTEAGRSFSVEGIVRICIPETDGRFKAGVQLKDLTIHDQQLWQDMIQRWRAFIW